MLCRGLGAGKVDEALVGARFGGLDAFQFGVRAQDRHLDGEGRARIAVAFAAQRLQRLGFRQQRTALHPADLPDRLFTAQARRQHLLDELVAEAGAAPYRIKAGLWKEVRERLRQPGGALSGGQQQRLCIARSLAVRPRVVLMDEPCSALDPTSTRVIEETIDELVREVTIVIVTHNMQQAQRVSHQCAFFLAAQGQPGYIVEYGPTGEMFDNPQDPRTADYVGGRFG